MQYVKSFRDLKVYQMARQLAKEVFEVSKTFPKEEMYSLTDQMRKSSRSVGGKIAEAWENENTNAFREQADGCRRRATRDATLA